MMLPWLQMARVTGWLGTIPVITCRGEQSLSCSLKRNESSSKELIIVGIVVVNSFQSCGANLCSIINDLRTASTDCIRDSTVPFPHCELETQVLCRMRKSFVKISSVLLMKWGLWSNTQKSDAVEIQFYFVNISAIFLEVVPSTGSIQQYKLGSFLKTSTCFPIPELLPR